MPFNPPATRFFLAPFLKRCIDREPIVALSCMLAGFGFVFPLVTIPLRNSVGLPTWQYDAITEQNIKLADAQIGKEAMWKGNQ